MGTKLGRSIPIAAVFALIAGGAGPICHAASPDLACVRQLLTLQYESSDAALYCTAPNQVDLHCLSAVLQLGVDKQEAAFHCRPPNSVDTGCAASLIKTGLKPEDAIHGCEKTVPVNLGPTS